jgi:hypothetical protein
VLPECFIWNFNPLICLFRLVFSLQYDLTGVALISFSISPKKQCLLKGIAWFDFRAMTMLTCAGGICLDKIFMEQSLQVWPSHLNWTGLRQINNPLIRGLIEIFWLREVMDEFIVDICDYICHTYHLFLMEWPAEKSETVVQLVTAERST